MYETAAEPESSGSVQRDDRSSAAGFFNLRAICAIVEHYLDEQHWSCSGHQSYHQSDSSPITIAVRFSDISQIVLKSIHHDRKQHHQL